MKVEGVNVEKATGERWGTARSRAKSFKQATSPGYTVPEADLKRIAHDLISVVMSVPEEDRPALYQAMLIFTHHRQAEGDFYRWGPAAGAFIKLANAYWPNWPPQQEETET